jgi:hypothetical protein
MKIQNIHIIYIVKKIFLVFKDLIILLINKIVIINKTNLTIF